MAFEDLDPRLRPYAQALYNWASANGWRPRITSVYRSIAEQQVLYERYIRGQSSLPAAKPGRSLHNYRLAFDMVVDTPAHQALLGRAWENFGGRWGGKFSDPPHFDTGATIP